jgi:hypothetical protein
MPNLDSASNTSPVNGASAAHDLFALTDEQILEIEPDAQDVEVREAQAAAPSDGASETRASEAAATREDAASPAQEVSARSSAPFSAAEEVRALAELYPGGLSQAKTAAERAHALDEIDAAYFGATNSTPEQVSVARAQLAQRMMREDPAAFREMVFAGLRALKAAGTASEGLNVAPPFRAASSASEAQAPQKNAGLKPGATLNSGDRNAESMATSAYAAFERNANEELERSVGAAIERTIAQALPNLGREEGANSAGARGRVSGFVVANPDPTTMPLRERLAASVRQDVEAALKGDRQLGEQIAQILAAKRFDDSTRAQVVRLINDRAQQLVPGAARLVIGEWTSATLATHGAKSERSAAASSRREVAAASSASSTQAQHAAPLQRGAVPRPRGVDYRKLSDEQILDL